MGKVQEELFLGRLGVNPELKHTKDGTAICNLSVAVNKTSDDKAIWKKVVVWDKQAEQCNLYLKKGSQVFVQGHVKSQSYLAKDGNTKTYEEVKVNLIGFLNL